MAKLTYAQARKVYVDYRKEHDYLYPKADEKIHWVAFTKELKNRGGCTDKEQKEWAAKAKFPKPKR